MVFLAAEIFLDLIPYFISLIVFMGIHIAVHELGHLVCGLISGYSFVSYRIGPFVWTKRNSKIEFNVSKIYYIAGQCLMLPPRDEKEFRITLYNIGGGLFNLILAAILIALEFVFYDNYNAFMILFAGIFVGIYLGLMNLIPRSKSVPNDGYNLKKASESEDARHGLYMMLCVNEEITMGKRFRDYSQEDFHVPEGADKTNIFVVYMYLLAFSRLFDMGLYHEAITMLDAIDTDVIPAYYRNSIMIDRLYHSLAIEPDYDKARAICEDKEIAKIIKSGMPTYLRTLAAYEFFLKDDREKGHTLLEQNKKQTQKNPSLGYRLMENEYTEHLEEKFRKAEREREA